MVGMYLTMFLCCWALTTAINRREEIVKNLLFHPSYDSRISPNYEDDFPTNVTIQIFVLSFDTVSEASMEFSVTIFLRVQWTDERLSWDGIYFNTDRCAADDGGNNSTNSICGSVADDEDDEVLDRLEVDTKLLDRVWMPDLYFVNDKAATVHDVTMINRMLHIHRDGSIKTSSRISMTLSCDMHLDRYPHDEQLCFIQIGSYSYSVENVLFMWHKYPVVIRDGVTLPRFNVHLSKTVTCDFNFNHGSMISGNYACIKAEFGLTRRFGYYIAQVYVPSCLIVMLSWVSFWIDLEAIPARVSLGLLTVLTMTTHSAGERASLPKVSYVKAIDVWMAGCLAFVFAALLEFAYVNVQSRVQKRRGESFKGFPQRRSAAKLTTDARPCTSTKNGANVVCGDTENNAAEGREGQRLAFSNWNVLKRQLKKFDYKGLQRARLADKIARVLFPSSFLVFNIVYWVVFKAVPVQNDS